MYTWKKAALALAGALAIVGGLSLAQESAACETAPPPSPEEQTRIRLTSALMLLEQAEREVKAATAARPATRVAALEEIALAQAQVKKGLASLDLTPPPPPRPLPKPLPRPRPVKAVDASVAGATQI